MTVRRVAVLALLPAGVAIAAVVLLLTRGSGNPAVAHVAGRPITRDQLAKAVDHFRMRAKAEGTPFPKDGTARFTTVRNRILGVLVYREELEQAAASLGIRVTSLQVLHRGNLGVSEPEERGDSFDYGSARSQLLYERIYAKVTSKVSAPNSVELSARRNAAMSRYIARLKRKTRVRYEPGYAPGP
jgi:hypothetical protein